MEHWDLIKEKCIILTADIVNSSTNYAGKNLIYEAMTAESGITTVTDLFKRLSQTLYGSGRCKYTTQKNIDKGIEEALEREKTPYDDNQEFMEPLGTVYCRMHLMKITPIMSKIGYLPTLKQIAKKSAKQVKKEPYSGITLENLVPAISKMLSVEDAKILKLAELPKAFSHSEWYRKEYKPNYIVCNKDKLIREWV